jgi:hypothetical protein
LIGVNNFFVKHILSIVYFTALTDKPMLDQKNIAGGYLGGGGGGGNNGGVDGAADCLALEGRSRRQAVRRPAAAAVACGGGVQQGAWLCPL